MKIMSIITRFFFVISIPALAFTASITFAVNNSDFYTYRFEKYDVKQSLADNGLTVSDQQLQDIADGFIRYFNSGEEFIHLTVAQDGIRQPLFNEEELIHFKDVKRLFVINYWVLGVSLAYFLVYAVAAAVRQKGRFRIYLAWNTVIGGGLTLVLMLIMGLGFLLNFDWLFYRFHLIAFTNSFWSASGNMLLLFPEGFWVDAVRYCALVTAGIAAGLGLIGWIYTRLPKNNTSISKTS